MSKYRVFLGAPSKAEVQNDPNSYSWRTLSSSASNPGSKSHLMRGVVNGSTQPQPVQPMASASVILPFPFALATLEAASVRISMIYKDVVFGDADPDEIYGTSEDGVDADQAEGSGGQDEIKDDESSMLPSVLENSENSRLREDEEKEVEISVFRGVEQTTMFTWAPTTQEDSRQVGDESRPRESQSFVGPSFLLTSATHHERMSLAHSVLPETQDLPESQSFGAYSDASSIARFPTFHFNLHSISSLSQLADQVSKTKVKLTRKVNLLLAVLEVEGPDTIRIKKGADAGKEVSILKMILGDEDGEVCKLTAWRVIAEEWGGGGQEVATKRGDIVHVEDVMATCEPGTSITVLASTYLKSALTICYRTMPYTHEDGRMRPDLRLGDSEPCVRKVATVVRWFEGIAGLSS